MGLPFPPRTHTPQAKRAGLELCSVSPGTHGGRGPRRGSAPRSLWLGGMRGIARAHKSQQALGRGAQRQGLPVKEPRQRESTPECTPAPPLLCPPSPIWGLAPGPSAGVPPPRLPAPTTPPSPPCVSMTARGALSNSPATPGLRDSTGSLFRIYQRPTLMQPPCPVPALAPTGLPQDWTGHPRLPRSLSCASLTLVEGIPREDRSAVRAQEPLQPTQNTHPETLTKKPVTLLSLKGSRCTSSLGLLIINGSDCLQSPLQSTEQVTERAPESSKMPDTSTESLLLQTGTLCTQVVTRGDAGHYSNQPRQPHASLQAGVEDTRGLVEDTGHPVPAPPRRRTGPSAHGCHTCPSDTQTRQFRRWLATTPSLPSQSQLPRQMPVGAGEDRRG